MITLFAGSFVVVLMIAATIIYLSASTPRRTAQKRVQQKRKSDSLYNLPVVKRPYHKRPYHVTGSVQHTWKSNVTTKIIRPIEENPLVPPRELREQIRKQLEAAGKSPAEMRVYLDGIDAAIEEQELSELAKTPREDDPCPECGKMFAVVDDYLCPDCREKIDG